MRQRRHRSDDEGFNLIELAVVLLIIAILLAIAIPTYLGVRSSAQNRAAQETIATLIRENGGAMSPALSCVEFHIDPAYTSKYWTAPSTGPKVVSSDSCFGPQGTGLAVLSRSGDCWVAMDPQGAQGQTTGVTYGVMPASVGLPCSIKNA